MPFGEPLAGFWFVPSVFGGSAWDLFVIDAKLVVLDGLEGGEDVTATETWGDRADKVRECLLG